VLLEVKTDRGAGSSILQKRCIAYDLLDIHKLDRFQRPPHFLQTSGDVRPVEHIDQRALERRDTYGHAFALCLLDSKRLLMLS
jgi:hypothetical protein